MVSYIHTFQIHGINMAIGIDGHLRRPMVGKIQGLEIIMRRSLRDIFRKVPKVSVEVKVIFGYLDRVLIPQFSSYFLLNK